MATTKKFDKYEVRIMGGPGGGTAETRVGLLLCYAGTAFVGRIDFYPDGFKMPEDHLWHPQGPGEYIVLQMPMSRFEAVMQTVRFEKPLQLYINVDRGIGAITKGLGYLTTSDKEPTGEEENHGKP